MTSVIMPPTSAANIVDALSLLAAVSSGDATKKRLEELQVETKKMDEAREALHKVQKDLAAKEADFKEERRKFELEKAAQNERAFKHDEQVARDSQRIAELRTTAENERREAQKLMDEAKAMKAEYEARLAAVREEEVRARRLGEEAERKLERAESLNRDYESRLAKFREAIK